MGGSTLLRTEGGLHSEGMSLSLAASITKAASKQTYYTIRLLVDRPMRDDAYRAYAYFRWLDDILDAEDGHGPTANATCTTRQERERFLKRQRWLLDECLRGESPATVDPCESLLVQLIRNGEASGRGLSAYLCNMMLVMDFDVRRRGRLITAAELDEYTRCLATAVTEAMHHFIGHGAATPRDETRYSAASGAHILHMLRDTYDDIRAGYYNVPRELLEANSIRPEDVESDAYRGWIADRVRLARAHFDAARTYLAAVPTARHRMAAAAYVARFDWLIHQLEEDDFRLRAERPQRRSVRSGIRTGWVAIGSAINGWTGEAPTPRIAWRR